KLQADPSIDAVVTLGAPFAATAVKAREQAASKAEIDTFDLNAQVATGLKNGSLGFAVDQQPYLQGYEAVDLLWLYKYNSAMIGGEFDLSAGVMVISSALISSMVSYQMTADTWVGVGVSLLVTLAFGVLNGVLLTRTKLPSFIITLGTFFMLTGLNLGFTKLI